MYDVVNDIRYCRYVIVKSIDNDKTDTFTLHNAKIAVYDHKSQFPITEEFLKEVGEIYNNLTITTEEFEMQILQDYGQDRIVPDGYEDIPNALTYATWDSNVGWFNGYISLIWHEGDMLSVLKVIEAPKINMDRLRDKRPFRYQLVTKDNKVYLYIQINSYDIENRQIVPTYYLADTHMLRDKLFSKENIYHMIFDLLNNSSQSQFNNYENKDGRKFLTRDLLVANGWNFIDGLWHKGEEEISDEGELIPYLKYHDNFAYYADQVPL